jgi:ABC-type antimicrobial peptide transport system permease subunit
VRDLKTMRRQIEENVGAERLLAGLVVRQVALTLAIGTSAGLAAAAAAGGLLQATLFGVAPWDPVVYGSALAVIVLTAFASAYVPARRASRVDPMVALRDE